MRQCSPPTSPSAYLRNRRGGRWINAALPGHMFFSLFVDARQELACFSMGAPPSHSLLPPAWVSERSGRDNSGDLLMGTAQKRLVLTETTPFSKVESACQFQTAIRHSGTPMGLVRPSGATIRQPLSLKSSTAINTKQTTKKKKKDLLGCTLATSADTPGARKQP